MRCFSMPKSVLRWTTSWSSSWNEPSSKRSWMRSRAVSFPSACWRAIRASPPPSSLSRLRRSSSSRFLFLTIDMGKVFFERARHDRDDRLGVGELDQTAVLEAIHDRSRQELDLTAVFHGHAILKQHLPPLTDGRDAVDTQPCDEDPIAVLDKSLPTFDKGNDLRSRPHRSKRDRPNAHPS